MSVNYELPVACVIGDKEYSIRNQGDYRVILDAIAALNDNDLSEQQQAYAALYIFYEKIPDDTQEAIKEMFRFINRGDIEEKSDPSPKVMDWEQDFPVIVAPVNRVLGTEVRALPYLHWWTFLAAYMEIGECTFSNIVSIREKRRKGIKLEKYEQEFYQNNRKMVDLKSNLTKSESEWIDKMMGCGTNGV